MSQLQLPSKAIHVTLSGVLLFSYHSTFFMIITNELNRFILQCDPCNAIDRSHFVSLCLSFPTGGAGEARADLYNNGGGGGKLRRRRYMWHHHGSITFRRVG